MVTSFFIKAILLKIFLIDAPEKGEVRLFHNSTVPDHFSGLLLVWDGSQWGTVSGGSWTTQNSEIVCRQLGRSIGS